MLLSKILCCLVHQAPAKPKTAYGEMLAYYLKMEPQLFKTAVEDRLRKIHEEKMAKEAAEKEARNIKEDKDKSELVLYQWVALLCSALTHI